MMVKDVSSKQNNWRNVTQVAYNFELESSYCLSLHLPEVP